MKTSVLFVLVSVMALQSFAEIAADLPTADINTLTAEAAVEFGSASIGRKMPLFEGSSDVECPLFSNSPYTDVLVSIDKMQSNLNTAFPNCENKKINDEIMTESVQFRKSVFEVQKISNSSQSYQIKSSVEKMVQIAQKIQNSLEIAAKAQTQVCYRENGQFRSVLFSMNEAFQSISPVILDLVSKNPALAKTMGSSLKVLVGLDSLSKGLGLVEQIAKDSVMFDMTNTTNRENTIKNVCHYMKFYRRLEYMRLSRLGRIQSIYTDYENKINEINKKKTEQLEQINKKQIIFSRVSQGLDGVGSNGSKALDPVVLAVSHIKNKASKVIERLQSAQNEFEITQGQLNRPAIAQCEIIKQIKSIFEVQSTMNSIYTLNDNFEKSDRVFSIIQQLKSYDTEISLATTAKVNNVEECSKLGQDWLKVALSLMTEGLEMVLHYEESAADLSGENIISDRKKLQKQEEQLVSTTTNYNILKSFINYSAIDFEASETEKRAIDMYRYFFKGPDYNEIKAVYCKQTKRTDCENSTWDDLMAWAKAQYQYAYNEGPVYELLRNNDLHFDQAYNEMTRGLSVVSMFEYNKTLELFGGKEPRKSADYKLFQVKLQENYSKMLNVNLGNIPHRSNLHTNICKNIDQAIQKYALASTHLLASQSLCELIKPVLKEEKISNRLRRYCLPSVSASSSTPSDLQKNIYKLVGAIEIDPKAPQVKRRQAAPKALVAILAEKYESLKCDAK